MVNTRMSDSAANGVFRRLDSALLSQLFEQRYLLPRMATMDCTARVMCCRHQQAIAHKLADITRRSHQPLPCKKIGTHLVDSVAIAVQRCTVMAPRASVEREARMAMEAAAA